MRRLVLATAQAESDEKRKTTFPQMNIARFFLLPARQKQNTKWDT